MAGLFHIQHRTPFFRILQAMKGLLDDYEFFFVDNAKPTTTQCYPKIDDLTWTDETDDEFDFYRRTLETSLQFEGADYTFLLAYEEAGCGELDFVVEYKGTEVYRGLILFGTSAITHDKRNCIFVIETEPQDNYTCLVENWTTEFNIFTGATLERCKTQFGTLNEVTESTTGSDFGALLAAGAPESFTPTEAQAYALLSWTITQISLGTFESEATWVTEEFTTDCSGGSPVPPPGGGWVLLADNCGSTSTADYGRKPALVQVEFTNDGIETYREIYEIPGGINELEIDNGVLFNDLLETIAPCSLSVVSDFFSLNGDDTYPSNDAYTAAKTYLAELVLYQKSDVRTPSAAANASLGQWDLKNLLLHLKLQFNVEPRIVDSGATLRLEHVSYWEANPGLDITVSPYAELVAAALEYSYNDADIKRLERWKFMEPVEARFEGVPIEYTFCIKANNDDEETYNMNRINNDIGFIVEFTDQVAKDGFVFASTAVVNSERYILSSFVSPVVQSVRLNGPLSIPNLQNDYHRWDRLLPAGNMNNTATTFETSRPRRQQVEFTINFPRSEYHNNFDPSQLVETELGVCEIDSCTYNAADCSLTLNLLF